MHFGISTHLYHDQRLNRDHLAEVAAHGFEAIELFATRSHFDYHDAAAGADLESWLQDTHLTLQTMHAPITERFGGGTWSPAFSIAARDAGRRERAVRETEEAMQMAQRLGISVVVLHVGVPDAFSAGPDDNARDAALRSIEAIQKIAAPLGIRLALEVIPNELSSAESLVRILEEELDSVDVGICVDFGHAHMMGDLVDAIELCSGHFITTHLHDNDGNADAHLAPFEGSIDWAAALMAARKVGYEGPMVMELANTSTPCDVLEKGRRARQRLQKIWESMAISQ